MVSFIILVATPSHTPAATKKLTDIDSLIVSTLYNNTAIGDNFRIFNVEIDSSFTRRVYRVPVHPSFSKTMFHYSLHESLIPFDVKTPASVLFPERNMNIYVYKDETVISTIRLITTEPKQEDGN